VSSSSPWRNVTWQDGAFRHPPWSLTSFVPVMISSCRRGYVLIVERRGEHRPERGARLNRLGQINFARLAAWVAHRPHAVARAFVLVFTGYWRCRRGLGPLLARRYPCEPGYLGLAASVIGLSCASIHGWSLQGHIVLPGRSVAASCAAPCRGEGRLIAIPRGECSHPTHHAGCGWITETLNIRIGRDGVDERC